MVLDRRVLDRGLQRLAGDEACLVGEEVPDGAGNVLLRCPTVGEPVAKPDRTVEPHGELGGRVVEPLPQPVDVLDSVGEVPESPGARVVIRHDAREFGEDLQGCSLVDNHAVGPRSVVAQSCLQFVPVGDDLHDPHVVVA